jgi:hypothetical protein
VVAKFKPSLLVWIGIGHGQAYIGSLTAMRTPPFRPAQRNVIKFHG